MAGAAARGELFESVAGAAPEATRLDYLDELVEETATIRRAIARVEEVAGAELVVLAR